MFGKELVKYSQCCYRTKLSLLTIFALLLLGKLGFWQLSRYQEKLALEQTLSNRQNLSPLKLSDINLHSEPMYLPLNVNGCFIKEYAFYLDNQVHEGQAGYDLIMPFVTNDKEWLLVNLGWLPVGSRETLPAITIPQGSLELTGHLYQLLGKPFTLGDDCWSNDWPKRIQVINFEKMAASIGHPLPSYILKLKENQPGTYQVRPLEIKITSQKHLSYAFQWFLMGLTLFGLYIWQIVQKKYEIA